MWPWDENTPLPTTNVYGHHGDGIKLALEEGAEVALMDSLMMFPFADVRTAATRPPSGPTPTALLVNANGERFIDETLDRYTMTEALMQQPDEVLFLISDRDTSRVEGDYSYYGRSIQRLIDQGQLFRADTLEELADQMGCDKNTFAATVERYNEIARNGEDPDFGRMIFTPDSPIENPPFYASPRTWGRPYHRGRRGHRRDLPGAARGRGRPSRASTPPARLPWACRASAPWPSATHAARACSPPSPRRARPQRHRRSWPHGRPSRTPGRPPDHLPGRRPRHFPPR